MIWPQFIRLALVATLGWLGAAGARADTTAVPVTPVTLTIETRLSGLHPNVTHGALDCGVVAQTGAWVSAHVADLTDNNSARRWVLGPAHYYGQEALLEFPVVNRAFSGALTYRAAIPGVLLTDPATHTQWAPAPTLLVACWLLLNGRPALWDRAGVPLVVTAENFASVAETPLALATGGVTGSVPVSLSATLVAQGNYFVPEPVNLVATVSIGSSSPYRSTARHAADSHNGSPDYLQTPSPRTATVVSTASAPAVHPGSTLSMAPAASLSVRTTAGESQAEQAAKAAGVWNSVGGILAEIVEALALVIWGAGGTATPADQAELASDVALETAAAVAAIISAVATIITELPNILDATPATFGYVHDPVYAPLSGPPVLVVQGPLAAPLTVGNPRPSQLTRQQIDAIIQSLPTDGSAPKTTAKLRALLQTIKPRN